MERDSAQVFGYVLHVVDTPDVREPCPRQPSFYTSKHIKNPDVRVIGEVHVCVFMLSKRCAREHLVHYILRTYRRLISFGAPCAHDGYWDLLLRAEVVHRCHFASCAKMLRTCYREGYLGNEFNVIVELEVEDPVHCTYLMIASESSLETRCHRRYTYHPALTQKKYTLLRLQP